ncbi:hypothetical protein RGU70_14390 [Herbaspirillum sp. RTI4]|uniref:prealbumin-like fold domain-containing protein n=1 Tax=Herbaspirillum sp. RTI4 TaxID=3048640 RepID=UPI002AB537B9|nr:hypothetical protein [Herbaspirillum sp. RTI4]MDY7579504.1 hypothetical protein [Herbaspirillum sp. RTI4]MEA9980418.1 hypothetical protein [Herbaspirillum sp. RTI4]
MNKISGEWRMACAGFFPFFFSFFFRREKLAALANAGRSGRSWSSWRVRLLVLLLMGTSGAAWAAKFYPELIAPGGSSTFRTGMTFSKIGRYAAYDAFSAPLPAGLRFANPPNVYASAACRDRIVFDESAVVPGGTYLAWRIRPGVPLILDAANPECIFGADVTTDMTGDYTFVPSCRYLSTLFGTTCWELDSGSLAVRLSVKTPDPASSGVRVVTDNQRINGGRDMLQALILASDGTRMPNIDVHFSGTPTVDFGAGPGAPTSCRTDATGRCSVTGSSPVAGVKQTRVAIAWGELSSPDFRSREDNALWKRSPASYTFIDPTPPPPPQAKVPDPAQSGVRVVTARETKIANGSDSHLLEALVRASDGTVLPGILVYFTKAGDAGGNSTGPVSLITPEPDKDSAQHVGCTTGFDGRCRIRASSTVSGDKKTQAQISGVGEFRPVSPMQTSDGASWGRSPLNYAFAAVPVTPRPGIDPAHGGVKVITNNQLADGKAKDVLEAYIESPDARPMSGVVMIFDATPGVSFSVDFDGAADGAEGAAARCLTDNAGRCRIRAVSSVPGNKRTKVGVLGEGNTLVELTATSLSVGGYSASPAAYFFTPKAQPVASGPQLSIVKTVLTGSGDNVFRFALSGLSAGMETITVSGAGTGSGALLNGTAGVAVSIAETSPAAWPRNPVSASCIDSNSALSRNPSGPLGVLNGNVLSIPADNMVAAARLVCTFTNTFSFLVTGRVFNDNGVGGGIANDGLFNGGEAGRPGVGVRLSDCGAKELSFATTDGSGSYALAVPYATPDGAPLCVQEVNPAPHVATGASMASMALPSGRITSIDGGSYTYTRSDTAARIAFVWKGRNLPGLNFGSVGVNTFSRDGTKAGLPGTTVIYPHIFTAQTDGEVRFSVQSPGTGGWGGEVFADASCSGTLQSGAVQLHPSGVATQVRTGGALCILLRQFIPANATEGATNDADVLAAFRFTNAAPKLTATYEVSDLTKVGGSAVDLKKEVRNVTQGGSFGISNSAKSGDLLEYRITYLNNGPSPVTGLHLNDATPNFTHFIQASVGATPATLTDCRKRTPFNPAPAPAVACSVEQTGAGSSGAVEFSFAGALPPGATGEVLFQVRVE